MTTTDCEVSTVLDLRTTTGAASEENDAVLGWVASQLWFERWLRRLEVGVEPGVAAGQAVVERLPA
jgi:hypothetical protein